MKYNLADKAQKSEAFRYFTILSNKKQIVEIKKVSGRRSISQNSYLHLLIGAFGAHFGYTLEEAKQIYKEMNPSVYSYQKTVRNIERTFWKSSADLTKEEMAKTIDHFMRVSAEAGYPLPLATDKEWLMRIENEIQRNRHYL